MIKWGTCMLPLLLRLAQLLLLLGLLLLLLPPYSIRNIEGKYEDALCQKSVSQELILLLSWNFRRMLKEENHLTKRQYVQATANTSITAVFITATTTPSM